MEILGVRIRIHPTFLWLLAIFFVVGGMEAAREPGKADAFAAFLVGGILRVTWPAVLFTFVVLHELAHSLVARSHGVHVQDITLLPIGGVARLEGIPESSRIEFSIAIAGPLLNFAVAGAMFGLMMFTRGLVVQGITGLLRIAAEVNIALGVFNLLPAFPMDGGRLLRAYLASRMDYLRATRLAARVGRWIAIIMGIVGILRFDFWLVLIAVFIYVSGKQEEAVVAARHAARGVWRLFGYAGPQERGSAGRPEAPPFPDDHLDVIDVTGEVHPDAEHGPAADNTDRAAADAFRKLADDMRADSDK